MTKKLLAVVLTVALLITSVVATSLTTVAEPTAQADSTTKYSTYRFNFDGKDEYGFYQAAEGDIKPAFTNNYDGSFTPTGSSTSTIAKVGAYKYSNNAAWNDSAKAILGDNPDNNVFTVTPPGISGSAMGNFVSPDSRIFDNNDYLASGSFDISFGRPGRFDVVFVFGQDKENTYALRLGPNNAGTIISYKFNKIGFDSETVEYAANTQIISGSYNKAFYWAHIDFYYDDNNHLNLTLTDDTGASGTITYNSDAIPKEYRAFALTTAQATNPYGLAFDNVELNFIPNIEPKNKTYTFDFEGSDEYGFYQAAEGDIKPAFTKMYSGDDEATTTSAIKKISVAGPNDSRNPTFNDSSKALLGEDGNNQVFAISKTSSTVGSAIGSYASPDSRIFNDNRYLVSGSFDISVGRAAQYEAVLLFGQDKTNQKNNVIRFGVANSKFCYNSSELDFSNQVLAASSSQYASGTFSNMHWFHVDFYYDAEGMLHFDAEDGNGQKIKQIKISKAISKENRAFALTSSVYGAQYTGYGIAFDNVKLTFTPDGLAPVEELALNGDANNDGKVDVCDLLRTKRYIAKPVIGIMEANIKGNDDIIDITDFNWLRQLFINPHNLTFN